MGVVIPGRDHVNVPAPAGDAVRVIVAVSVDRKNAVMVVFAPIVTEVLVWPVVVSSQNRKVYVPDAVVLTSTRSPALRVTADV
jgi:hypothetical protein